MYEAPLADQVPVVAVLTALAGCETAVTDALRSVIPQVLEEPGCVVYALHVDRADPARIVMIEAWENRPAFDAHLAGSAFAALGRALDGLLVGPPALTLLQRIG